MNACPHIDRMPRYKGLPRLFCWVVEQGFRVERTQDRHS